MNKKKSIKVVNANENNLKNVSIEIPQGVICGVCGVSGSGKSTLAKEVIARTGSMSFADGLPVYLKRKFFDGRHPDVLAVNDLPPVYMVDIKNASKNSRSTVATVSGLMSIIRNIYCVNASEALEPRLFSYNISQENGGGACPECQGTGRSDTINLSSIIGDEEKSVLEGGFKCVNAKGIKNTKITEKFVEAFCKKYSISLDEPISKLTNQEMNLLLYGSEEVINFTDRSGANGGKKALSFPGIIGALIDVFKRTQNDSISKYIVKGKCPLCGGTRFNSKARKYIFKGKTISDFLDMSISESAEFIKEENNSDLEGLKSEYLSIAAELINIGVGYLNLSRPVSSVSGGELQRIKLSKCLASDVYNGCFVLDEPSTGLHFADIDNLIRTLYKLKQRGNSIIIVEHNLKILQNCDYIIEMGENGGEDGGNVVFSGTFKDLIKRKTKTGSLFDGKNNDKSERINSIDKKIKLKGIKVNNIDNESIEIPLKAFTTVVGVSGSGKSSAINIALYGALKKYVDGEKNDSLELDEKICDVISLNQEQGVANSRSIVATYLGIMDSIRDLYATLSESKKNGFDKTFFSMTSGKGLCPECGGRGVIKDEDGESEEVCPVCMGRRFIQKVLDVHFKGYNISELLHLEIEKLCDVMKNHMDISLLEQCKAIGVGYLALDRPMPSLSKGEFQRVRIAKEIADAETTKKVFILDEPSKGLHVSDAYKIVSSIGNLVKKGNTVIAIEHNLNVVEKSDYVIEFGPGAGKQGGKVMFSGIPAELKKAKTITGESYRKRLDFVNADFHEDHVENISFTYNNVDISIVKNQINMICGGIGSGKSVLADKGLFAYPFKKYTSMINTQGKYLTRDVEAISVGCDNLPISRIISSSKSFFGKNERLTESLNIDYYITKVFYGFGLVKCPSCGKYSSRVGNYTECTECGKKGGLIIHQSAFAYGKRSCKCPTCKGKGRFEAYDFNAIMDNSCYREALMDLLYDRTRIDRIAPLLKEKYEIDIKKKFDNMSDEEKRIFLYGDTKKEVIYKPKNKTYTWAGCNELVNTNLQYSKSLQFQDFCKKTYINRLCPQCNGIGFAQYILDVKYKEITFGEFITSSIHQVYELLADGESCCEEENKLRDILKAADNLGLGDLKLNSYTQSLSLADKSIVQYLKYKYSPIQGSALLWDDFSLGKNKKVLKMIISMLNEDIKNGMYVVLFDKEKVVSEGNVINLNDKFHLEGVISGPYSNVFINKTAEEEFDKTEMLLTSRTTIASVAGIVADVREAFKSKNNKYAYSLPDDKCVYCDGAGLYEINYGIVGMQKRSCMYCNGTGYDQHIMGVKISGCSFPEIINSTVDEVYDWLITNGFKASAKKLEIFRRVGLGYLKINQGVSSMSSNESSIVLLIKVIHDNKGKKATIKNFFVCLSDEIKNNLLSLIDKECINYNFKLYLQN